MIKRIIALAAFAAVLFVSTIFVSTAAARQQGNSIRGKVRNSAGITMPRIVVDLQTSNGLTINQTVTNNEGDFFFTGLNETAYIVVVSATDYISGSERVEFGARPAAAEGSVGETHTIEIVLVPVSGERVQPARSAFTQAVPQAARDAFDRAMKLARENKGDESIAAMREAIKLFPDYFDARFMLASELIKAGRLDDAIAELDHARRINPKDDRVFQSFGLVLVRQGKHAVAARIFGEAARLNPTNPQVLLLRAGALIDYAASVDPAKVKDGAAERSRAFEMAEKDLAKAYEMSNKKLAAVHQQRARLYERKGDRARAADELEQYLKMTPNAKNAEAIREAIKKLRTPAS